MKVPLTRDELANGSFTSIAKYVGRHWPGEGALTLSAAQNLVATCCGYDDLHDAQQQATDKLPPVSPGLHQAQELACRALIDQHGLSSDKAAAFVRQWPWSKLRFALAPAGSLDCPVTRHHQWRFLLRELAPLPEFRWLSSMTTEQGTIALQPVVALARAIALWEPDLVAREHLAIDLVGANEVECVNEGRYFGLLPLLWGRPGMRIDLRLIGLEAADRFKPAVPPGLPPYQATVVRRRFGDYRNSDAYRRPAVTVLASPGLTGDADTWLSSDDGLLDAAARNALIWYGYDWDDAETDQKIMQAYGLKEAGPIDRNPFVVETRGAVFTYGMASWRSGPGLREVKDTERERIVAQVERVSEMSAIAFPDFQLHQDAIAKMRRMGELAQIEHSDGSLAKMVVLGDEYFLRLDTGAIVKLPGQGATPVETGLVASHALLSTYPGADVRWIDRACWAAQVRIDKLDEYDENLLFRGLGPAPDMGEVMDRGLDILFRGSGLDAAAIKEAKDAFVPRARKPIAAEHKPFFQCLNKGDLEAACAMLQADPSLATAENDEGQTALFYACRSGHLGLAGAFASAKGNLEHSDREHWSALSDAARKNQGSVITLLATYGADVEHGNAIGWTPLQVAMQYRAADAGEALVEAGADLDRPTLAGWTPRQMATELGLHAVLQAEHRTRQTH